MSEKQQERASDPETDQLDDGQVRPHPETPSGGESQPTDTGHSQHEAADAPDQKSRGTGLLSGKSCQVKPNLGPEASASDSHSDSQSAIREQSHGDKRRDSGQNPGSSMVSERRSVGEGPVPEVRRKRYPVGDVRGGKTTYFVVHENRASVDVHCESGGVIGERNPTTTGQSSTREKDPGRPSAIKGGTRCLGDDGLVTTSSSDPEQGYSSDSLLLPDARKKGRSHVHPVDKGRRTTVWYIPLEPQGRDIFEAGGEESQNPKLNPLLGVVQDGSDRIERLPAESSAEGSPAVETTPVATSVATSRSWTNSLDELIVDPLNECFCCICRWVGSKFSKAPFFYTLSVMVILFALVAFQEDSDVDILACLLSTVVACVLLSVMVPRGAWSKGGDRLEGVGFFSWRPSGLCGECCGEFDHTPPPARRHSKYYHPLEEEAHTAFEHEVADVSNIDPKDCPQMRMVEEEILKSESPDYPPDFRQLNVDIHAPGSPKSSKEVEEAVPRKQGATKKLAKIRTRSKSKSSSALLKVSKDSKAEEVPAPHTAGQPEDLSNADLGRNIPDEPAMSFALKSTLTSLIAETAAAYNVNEFVCEHDGQGVACSCFADRWK